MLVSLHIRNFALIEKLDVEFQSGLSIITGETGAGKSIILGAIDLLCGKRADLKSLRDKSLKATVEAEFDITNHTLVKRKLADADYDVPEDGKLYLCRELSPSGRSRAFINDTPVNLQILGDIASSLLDVHSQHQTQAIVADPRVRMRFVDALSNDPSILSAYKAVFQEYRTLRNQVRQLRDEIAANTQKRELLSFQFNQLSKLNLKLGEQKNIESLYDIRSRAQEIKSQLTESMSLLGRSAAEDAISKIERSILLLRKTNIDSMLKNDDIPLIKRLEGMLIDLKDVVDELEDINAGIEDDPASLQKLEDRLNELYEAQLQFKVKDADELVRKRDEIEAQLKQTKRMSSELPELEVKLKHKGEELKAKAALLTQQRKEIAVVFSAELETMAKGLGLANLKFKVDLKETKLSSDGADQADFLCAFNKNQPFMQLQDTASGGEASRLMLCMKAIIAGKTDMPTLIFDEIDTGISGEIANKAGRMMRDMAASLQVIAITHLPQVAVAGHSHYKVYKQDTETETLTQIKRLSNEERRVEIAKMLSGASVDDAALDNAASLLNAASNQK
jgi:DNA repair protein RecN (Recombination protein N)